MTTNITIRSTIGYIRLSVANKDETCSVENQKLIIEHCAYFGDIRTLISETSGQRIGIIRTAYRKYSDTLPG